jgi:hypothetical protein
MGRNSVNRKLTNKQVLEIRTQFRDGVLQKVIGTKFGISQGNVSSIVIGLHYKDAPWPPSLSSNEDRRSLPDFPGYEFDNKGNAFSFKYNKRYGKKKRLWPDSKKGYLMVPLIDKNGKQHNKRVNRIICTLFNGPPPTIKHQAMHLNGMKTDNRAVNLVWGTQSENELDKKKHGTNPVGEKVRNSKLTENIVRQIRSSNESSHKLAIKYNVSQPNILNVIHRRTWKHVS